jgi:hypothetical protein
VDLPALQSLWSSVIEAIKAHPSGGRLAWMAAQSAWPTDVKGSELTITFDNVGPLNMVKSRGLDKLFIECIASVSGRTVTVQFNHDANLTIPSGSPAIDLTPRPVAAATPVAVVEPEPTPEPVEVPAPEVVEEPAVNIADDVPSDDDPEAAAESVAESLAQALGGTIIDEYDEKSR